MIVIVKRMYLQGPPCHDSQIYYPCLSGLYSCLINTDQHYIRLNNTWVAFITTRHLPY